VLVVDDEAAIRRFLRVSLETQGYACVEAPTGVVGLWAVRHHRPDLILLDLGLPDRDGLALIPEIRALTDAPLLVLTVRDDEGSKVRALDTGADDYVTKPFGVPELLARLRAALRHRVQSQGGRARVDAGPLGIDLVYRRVTRDGAEVRLSPKEWAILERLLYWGVEGQALRSRRSGGSASRRVRASLRGRPGGRLMMGYDGRVELSCERPRPRWAGAAATTNSPGPRSLRDTLPPGRRISLSSPVR
jgi:two-component system KDP operon response regulator KdpE